MTRRDDRFAALTAELGELPRLRRLKLRRACGLLATAEQYRSSDPQWSAELKREGNALIAELRRVKEAAR